ncbi:hypothetical protein [Rhodococcus ruber]|uniref:hypothetical protein n=1 Tax=Rhodococcus ruber TaxID=1830 RepID=UPI00378510A0
MKGRRVIICYQYGDGGPVVAVFGRLRINGGTSIYPRNGYLELDQVWPAVGETAILNRRVVTVFHVDDKVSDSDVIAGLEPTPSRDYPIVGLRRPQ